jgi:hypothetical protein
MQQAKNALGVIEKRCLQAIQPGLKVERGDDLIISASRGMIGG